MPDDSIKADTSATQEQIRPSTPQTLQGPGMGHQNGGFMVHNGINGGRHLNGHQGGSETPNGIVIVPHNRTTRSKPSQQLIVAPPV